MSSPVCAAGRSGRRTALTSGWFGAGRWFLPKLSRAKLRNPLLKKKSVGIKSQNNHRPLPGANFEVVAIIMANAIPMTKLRTA
jgi:hypothetical protein